MGTFSAPGSDFRGKLVAQGLSGYAISSSTFRSLCTPPGRSASVKWGIEPWKSDEHLKK